MTVHDDTFLTFYGDPVTGRVPARLHVHGNIELNADQQSGVQAAYRRFREAHRLSVMGNATVEDALPDGTVVRIISIADVDDVQVWPPPGGVELRGLRGFVLRPFWADPGDVEDGLDDPILLEHDGTWQARIIGYKPGDEEAIGYTTLDAADNPVVSGIQVDSEQEYFDVVSLWDGTLHLNGVGYLDATGASDQALPVLITGAEPPTLLTVEQSTVKGWTDGVIGTLYNFASYFVPLAGGFAFQAGPRYDPSARKWSSSA